MLSWHNCCFFKNLVRRVQIRGDDILGLDFLACKGGVQPAQEGVLYHLPPLTHKNPPWIFWQVYWPMNSCTWCGQLHGPGHIHKSSEKYEMFASSSPSPPSSSSAWARYHHPATALFSGPVLLLQNKTRFSFLGTAALSIDQLVTEAGGRTELVSQKMILKSCMMGIFLQILSKARGDIESRGRPIRGPCMYKPRT
jgi:hypothetical protein